MHQHRSLARIASAVIALTAALTACSRHDASSDSTHPKGAAEVAQLAKVDTGLPLGATPAEGAAQVTSTDAKSVTTATEYKLTETNFRQFLAASDSLAALRKRDPQVREFLSQQIADNGNGTKVSANNAGPTHLASNPAVSAAITSSGMSVTDYFVAAIAIAQAERFMGNPKAAPPTPTLGPNAEFLNAHKAQLAALKASRGS